MYLYDVYDLLTGVEGSTVGECCTRGSPPVADVREDVGAVDVSEGPIGQHEQAVLSVVCIVRFIRSPRHRHPGYRSAWQETDSTLANLPNISSYQLQDIYFWKQNSPNSRLTGAGMHWMRILMRSRDTSQVVAPFCCRAYLRYCVFRPVVFLNLDL